MKSIFGALASSLILLSSHALAVDLTFEGTVLGFDGFEPFEFDIDDAIDLKLTVTDLTTEDDLPSSIAGFVPDSFEDEITFFEAASASIERNGPPVLSAVAAGIAIGDNVTDGGGEFDFIAALATFDVPGDGSTDLIFALALITVDNEDGEIDFSVSNPLDLLDLFTTGPLASTVILNLETMEGSETIIGTCGATDGCNVALSETALDPVPLPGALPLFAGAIFGAGTWRRFRRA